MLRSPGMRRCSLWLAGLALVLLCAVQPARADSYYELERTQKLLTRLGLTPDDAPDRKRIAYVKVGRHVRFEPAVVERWIADARQETEPAS